MRKKLIESTDNVLVDLEFEDAEELSAKAVLAVKLNDLAVALELSRSEVARLSGMTQPEVSQVRLYKLQAIPLARITRAVEPTSRSLRPDLVQSLCIANP